MTQLELPLSDLKVGQRVRLMERYQNRRWPGAPAEETVRVVDGVILYVLPAGEPPSSSLGWFPPKSRPSKYVRLVLQRRWSTRKVVIETLGPTVKVFDGDLAG